MRSLAVCAVNSSLCCYQLHVSSHVQHELFIFFLYEVQKLFEIHLHFDFQSLAPKYSERQWHCSRGAIEKDVWSP